MTRLKLVLTLALSTAVACASPQHEGSQAIYTSKVTTTSMSSTTQLLRTPEVTSTTTTTEPPTSTTEYVQPPPSTTIPQGGGSREVVVQSKSEGPVVSSKGGVDDVWSNLAQCESGQTNANTGNGYYGYFQFSESTWWAMGEDGHASDYEYSYQLGVAQRLQARSGWGQWPACARALGLL